MVAGARPPPTTPMLLVDELADVALVGLVLPFKALYHAVALGDFFVCRFETELKMF